MGEKKNEKKEKQSITHKKEKKGIYVKVTSIQQ